MADGWEWEEEGLRRELQDLEREHGGLDAVMAGLLAGACVDSMQLQRLKTRKRALRDRIAALRDALLPDIIA